MVNETAATYKTVVHFATSSEPKVIATFEVGARELDAQDAAFKAAYRYLGADARGVWVEYPNGYREAVV